MNFPSLISTLTIGAQICSIAQEYAHSSQRIAWYLTNMNLTLAQTLVMQK